MSLGWVFKTFVLQEKKMARKKIVYRWGEVHTNDTTFHPFDINFKYSNKF